MAAGGGTLHRNLTPYRLRSCGRSKAGDPRGLAPRRDSGFLSKPLLTFFTPLAPRWFPSRFPAFPPHSARQPEACRRASGVRLQARVASSGHLSPMTTLRLVGGLPLVVGGELAIAGDCCCTGACCKDGECSQKTQAACAADSGVWQGAGVPCLPNPCSGCCCIDGETDPAYATKAACETAGGTWVPDGVCDPNPCYCPLSNLDDTVTQTVTLSSGCSCSTGSLSGTGNLTIAVSGNLSSAVASITTNCDVDDSGSTLYATASISVDCCQTVNGEWRIRVFASSYVKYGASFSLFFGYSPCGTDITVDQNGLLSGSVTFDIKHPSGSPGCSVTVSFN